MENGPIIDLHKVLILFCLIAGRHLLLWAKLVNDAWIWANYSCESILLRGKGRMSRQNLDSRLLKNSCCGELERQPIYRSVVSATRYVK